MISSAMAGDAAMPGESIPDAWMKFLSLSEALMIQSPTSVLDRAPENEWIDSSVSKSGTRPRQAARILPSTSSLLSGSVLPSGHSCWSRAVGPRMRLPHRVFCTKMPLP